MADIELLIKLDEKTYNSICECSYFGELLVSGVQKMGDAIKNGILLPGGLSESINERLINEYISKIKCCDECFASVFCTVNGLRESRVPQDYCVENIKRYFIDQTGCDNDHDCEHCDWSECPIESEKV